MVMKINRLLLGLAAVGWMLPSSFGSINPGIDVHGQRMTLRGESLLRVGYVFKVYQARLFVGEDHATANVQDDVPKRLEISYLRDIKAADIIRIGDETLQRQLPADQLAALQSRLQTINRWYTDVRDGDTYALTYVPGHGCELALNGTSLGVIEGADFARAYFGIWLDPRTSYKEFRRELLGERQP